MALSFAILAFPLIVTAQPTPEMIATINAEGSALEDLVRAIPGIQTFELDLDLGGNIQTLQTKFPKLPACYASFDECR